MRISQASYRDGQAQCPVCGHMVHAERAEDALKELDEYCRDQGCLDYPDPPALTSEQLAVIGNPEVKNILWLNFNQRQALADANLLTDEQKEYFSTWLTDYYNMFAKSVLGTGLLGEWLRKQDISRLLFGTGLWLRDISKLASPITETLWGRVPEIDVVEDPVYFPTEYPSIPNENEEWEENRGRIHRLGCWLLCPEHHADTSSPRWYLEKEDGIAVTNYNFGGIATHDSKEEAIGEARQARGALGDTRPSYSRLLVRQTYEQVGCRYERIRGWANWSGSVFWNRIMLPIVIPIAVAVIASAITCRAIGG